MTTNKKAEAETPQAVFDEVLGKYQTMTAVYLGVMKSHFNPGVYEKKLAELEADKQELAARYATANNNAMPPVYRIQSGAGWFSSGGSAPTFDPKKGKAWGNIGHVKNHLRMLMEIRRRWRGKLALDTIPEDWRVIETRGPVTRSVNARALMAGTGELA